MRRAAVRDTYAAACTNIARPDSTDRAVRHVSSRSEAVHRMGRGRRRPWRDFVRPFRHRLENGAIDTAVFPFAVRPILLYVSRRVPHVPVILSVTQSTPSHGRAAHHIRQIFPTTPSPPVIRRLSSPDQTPPFPHRGSPATPLDNTFLPVHHGTS